MKRTRQPVSALRAWLDKTDIRTDGIQIQRTRSGSGIVTTESIVDGRPLIHVPSCLVLSKDYVWSHARKDSHLRDCLAALDDFCTTSRGSILVFLLLQIAATSPEATFEVGLETPWTTYIQFLPDGEELPTFWSDMERQYLHGTTLEPALNAKLSSLRREFDLIQSRLSQVGWFNEHWTKTGLLTFNDWRIVDAMYRSRAMEIPSHGSCMVPVIDMANHGHRKRISARSDVATETGDVNLVTNRDGSNGQGRSLGKGEEVLITYGEEKGACEMLFSYGFIDDAMHRAETLFLSIPDDPDDPLFEYKKLALPCTPGVKLSCMVHSDGIKWNGAFVWLHCVTQDDGFRIIGERTSDGATFKAYWHDRELKDVVDLDEALASDEMYNLFRLRACTLIRNRVIAEIQEREDIQRTRSNQPRTDKVEKSTIWRDSLKLFKLERSLLQTAEVHFSNEISQLYETRAVKAYWDLLE